jgi:hypothetical protein
MGTLWEVIPIHETDKPEYFVQVSDVKGEPDWRPFGEVVAQALSKCTMTKNFIKKMISLLER